MQILNNEKDYIIEYDDSPEMKEKVFNRIIQYFKKHNSWSGESVMQCDNPQMEAPEVMAEIADDIIKFKVEHYNKSDTKNTCPKCGELWDDHEFGVPAPYCPIKVKYEKT